MKKGRSRLKSKRPKGRPKEWQNSRQEGASLKEGRSLVELLEAEHAAGVSLRFMLHGATSAGKAGGVSDVAGFR